MSSVCVSRFESLSTKDFDRVIDQAVKTKNLTLSLEAGIYDGSIVPYDTPFTTPYHTVPYLPHAYTVYGKQWYGIHP